LASLSIATRTPKAARLSEIRAQVDAIPAAQDRRVPAAPALTVDRAGKAQPDAVDRNVAVIVEQEVEPLHHVGHQIVGPSAIS
jgi:hypothetical protein